MELSQESLEFLTRVAPGYVGIYAVVGDSVRQVFTSPNLHELLGMTSEEFAARAEDDVSKVVFEEDLPGTLDAVHRCIETGKPFDRYARVVHKTEGFDWVHGNVSYAGELDGASILLATFSNASVESNIYLRVIDNSERLIYVCDRTSYEVLYMNKAARGVHGDFDPGDTCYSRIRNRTTPCPNCYLGDIHDSQQLCFKRHDAGTGVWERLLCENIEWCGHDAFIQYIDDITESENLHDQLKDAKDRYELAIEGAELGVWEYHPREHSISSPSHSFQRFGMPDVIENVPEAILPIVAEKDRPELLDLFRRIDEGERRVSADIWMQWKPDMAPRCERVVYSVMADEDGVPTVAYGIGMNVTLEKLEEERYERLLQSLLAANPDALCAFELNLTRNLSREGHGTSAFIVRMLQSSTVDELLRRIEGLITSDEDRERFHETFTREKLLEAFEAGRTSLSVDYRRRDEDGRTFWARTAVSTMRNPDTQDVTAIMYSTDVTEERRRTEILRVITSQEYDLIALLHLDTGVFESVFVGDSLPSGYREFFSAPGDSCSFERVCHRMASLVNPSDSASYQQYASLEGVRSHIEARGSYEFTMTMRFPDRPGTTRRRYQHYLLDEDPNAVLFIESDITETYRRQQEALDRAKAETTRVRDILNSISAGICVLHMPDPDHLTIEYVNQQMYRLLGFVPTTGTGTAASDRDDADSLIPAYFSNAFVGVHPDDAERVRATFRDNYESAYFVVENYRTMGANGAYYWIREEVTLREMLPGSRVFYAVFHDVSEEVRLSRRLHEQLEEEKSLRDQAVAANESKSSFLSSVSHDMRTPLNGVLGYADLALESNDLSVVHDYLRKTKDAGSTLLSLINDTLDLSKIETGRLSLDLEPVPCDRVIASVVNAVRPSMDAKHITFTIDNERAVMATIMTDKLLLEKVFLNLLNNATKFTPEGGHITFTVECLGLEPHVLHDRVIISDDGIGISSDFLPKIFEPFSQEHTERTSNNRGSGLGLSIMHDIVDLMGGHIECKSQLGKGTAFTVLLDFALAEKSRADVTGSRGASGDGDGDGGAGDSGDDIAGVRVLLVEDNAMNVEIARTLLERRGATVTCAGDGAAAVATFSAAPDDFDVVLMDIRMPVMDGYHATEAIHALGTPQAARVPIIAMSADAYDSDIRHSLEVGMCAHIAKPVDPEALFRAIHRAVRESKLDEAERA